MRNNDPYCIAEAGSCHEGLLVRALDLIEVANIAGANAVKFQYWSDPHQMRKRRHIDNAHAYATESIRKEWLPTLKERCNAAGMDLIVTVFLKQDIAALDDYVDAFKVSSFEAMDGDLVKACPTSKPLYVSTGMCDPDDVGKIIGFKDRSFVLLTCVSAYPCPMDQANLGGMYEGYSDHTKNVHTGGLAVAAGAKVLEVHFRLMETSPNCPDYCVSLTPTELRKYIDFARQAYRMMSYSGRPSCEQDNRKYRVLPCSS